MNVEESASAAWAREHRKAYSKEAQEQYEKHDRIMEPIVEFVKTSGDLEPTQTPTGEDVTRENTEEGPRAGVRGGGLYQVRPPLRVHQQEKGAEERSAPRYLSGPGAGVRADPVHPQRLYAESVHGGTYGRQGPLTMELVDYIRSLGYRVQVSGPTWHYGPMIPMFVEAGLGQLGANGQLLSRHFGSRARLQIILTDAQVTYDQPVDYGIHAFCQICLVCVNRCPGRGLMREKVWYRGVEKNKLVFDRCRPVMARYLGCGVCMKVCA